MSIFKESFRKFVKAQFAIREAIVSMGNTHELNKEAKNSRDKTKIVRVPNGNVTLPAGAVYKYHQKTCVIRMASGGNLTEEGAEVLGTENKFYKKNQLYGSGLARRFVLMGGTLAIDRSVGDAIDERVTMEQKARVDKVLGKTWNDGFSKTKRYRKESYKYNLAKRSGFTGVSKNQIATAYGDPTIASQAGLDNFGAVPMPGITNVEIRTKSAYGSLREAKVKFIVHNQKQLEACELLYMRPGIPILLEWGWSTYIDNLGKMRGDKPGDFPFETTLGNFFIREFDLSEIYQNILDEKRDSGGNYDGMCGMCKNFKYVAREDGGYDCETEIIAMGEVLETLKGEKLVVGKQTKDAMEMGLDLFLQFSTAVADTTNNLGENRWGITNALYFGWKHITSWKSLALTFGISRVNPYAAAGYVIFSAFVNAKRAGDIAKGKELFDLFDLNDQDEDGNYVNAVGGTADGRLERLKQYILNEEQYIGGTKSGMWIDQPYIRWDALVMFLNKHVIDKDARGKGLMKLSTAQIIEDGEAGLYNKDAWKLEPLLYCKIPRFKVPYKDENGFVQRTEVYTDDTAWYNFGLDYNGTINVNDLIDMSVDPSVCLMPGQVAEGTENPEGAIFDTEMQVASIAGAFFPYVGVGTFAYKWVNSKRRVLTADTSENVGADWKRVIGNIYFNLPRLHKLYLKERYDNEGNLNENFNLFDYLKKIWDDVNAATGHNHKFMLHCDHDRPDIVRVIDQQFQQEESLTRDKMHVLKIQSNESVCRDFAYNSQIPNKLSTTIAISVQNPDNIDSIENATFAALSRNIKSRFHVPKDQEEDSTPTAQEKQAKEAMYDKLLIDIRDQIDMLFEHRVKILKGKYEKVDDEGESKNAEIVGRMGQTLKDTYAKILKEQTLYPWTDNAVPYYCGFFKKKDNIPRISSVIPLKFTAKVDGISGIVIGNVFLVDESRLPKAYQKANVAFVVTKEAQTLTAGGDWSTTFEGQIMMLPGEAEDLPDFHPRLGQNFFDEDKGVNYIGDTDAASNWSFQGIITKEQSVIPPDMEEVTVGSKVYHKIGREEKYGTNVRISSKVDNESYWDFGEDNVIGMINPGAKGILLGTVLKVTLQETVSNMDWDEKRQAYMMKDPNFTGEGEAPLVEAQKVANTHVPWYLIQFNYTKKEFWKNWDLGANREWDGELDMNGAGWWKYWFNRADPPGWDTGWDCDWWQERSKKGKDPFLVTYSKELDKTYNSPGNVKGQGWMRIDTLQANAAYGFTRAENIQRAARAKVGAEFASDPTLRSDLTARSAAIISGWNTSKVTVEEQGLPNSTITGTEIQHVTGVQRSKLDDYATDRYYRGLELTAGLSSFFGGDSAFSVSELKIAQEETRNAVAEQLISAGFFNDGKGFESDGSGRAAFNASMDTWRDENKFDDLATIESNIVKFEP
jgi:hypothetical protein